MELFTIEEKLKKYAELKIMAKALDEQMEELKPSIREHMMSQGIDKLPTTIGTFTLGERTTWKYSKAVDTLQKQEKADGTAQAVKSVVLTYKEGKEEEGE